MPESDGSGTRAVAVPVEVDGRRFSVTLLEPDPPHVELARRRAERIASRGRSGAARNAVASPMQGTVLEVRVEEGDEVVAGDVVCIVEAMKMENEIRAHQDGRVTELAVIPGQAVAAGFVICTVEREPAA